MPRVLIVLVVFYVLGRITGPFVIAGGGWLLNKLRRSVPSSH